MSRLSYNCLLAVAPHRRLSSWKWGLPQSASEGTNELGRNLLLVTRESEMRVCSGDSTNCQAINYYELSVESGRLAPLAICYGVHMKLLNRLFFMSEMFWGYDNVSKFNVFMFWNS
jgi:hypothetical protein